jgi:hypothetical protein
VATNLEELIADRRTVHDYRPEPLPEGALERGLGLALAGPNHRMTEPWRFVRVGPEGRQALVDISAELKRGPDGAPLAGSSLDKLRNKMLSPAELIVVCQVKSDDPEVSREDYAEGIGSKWSTGAVTTDERTYQRLGIDPASEEIVGFLWVGYGARKDAPKPRRRRSLADVLRSVP